MAITLTSLPVELFQDIVANLDSSSDLCNLTRCSSALFVITIPFLYDHIDQEGGTFCHPCKDLRPLASLLLRRPELAQLVRHFTMRVQPSTGYITKARLKTEVLTGLLGVDDVFKKAIKAASHDEEEEQQWLEHMSWPDHGDATLALLLPALPRLESVDMVLTTGSTYFENMLCRAGKHEKPFNKQPGFLSLKDVVYTRPYKKHDMGVEYIGMFMRLPSVSRIFCHHVGSAFNDGVDETLSALETASSTVTHLEFKDARLHEWDIAHILQAPKALKTFIYEMCRRAMWWYWKGFCNITTALSPHEHCLENLWLDYHYESPSKTDSMIRISSFAQFEKLKVLKVAIMFILGEETFSSLPYKDWKKAELYGLPYGLTKEFPRNLEELHLLHCEQNFGLVLVALEDMLKHKERDLPHLRKLVLEGRLLDQKQYWSRIISIIQQAEARGVETITVNTKPQKFVHRTQIGRACGMNNEIFWAESANSGNWRSPHEIIDLQRQVLD